jgi:hypothetical protein
MDEEVFTFGRRKPPAPTRTQSLATLSLILGNWEIRVFFIDKLS